MSFTLEIKFRCLCFFAADERDLAAKRMHVLMPNTAGHDHGSHGNGEHDHAGHHAHQGNGHARPIDRHVVQLVFPKAGGNLGFDGNGNLVPMPDGGGIATALSMEGWSLELPGPGRGADTTFLEEMVDLSRGSGPVNPALLDQPAHPGVISRVVLADGSATHQKSGADWAFRGVDGPIAQEVVWTITDVPGDRLTWRRTRLDGSASEELPEIPAVDDLVEISIYHVTQADFPTPQDAANPNQIAEHFQIYHTLFKGSGDTSVPKFLKERETQTITCLTGGGRVP
jgi:hypothetical protein